MTTRQRYVAWVKKNFDKVAEPHDLPGHCFARIGSQYYGPINIEGAGEFFQLLPPDEMVEFVDYLQQGI